MITATAASHGQAVGSVNITPVESVSYYTSGQYSGYEEGVTLGNGATAIMGDSTSIGSTGTAYGQHYGDPYSYPYGRTFEIADGILNNNETTYYQAGYPDSYAGFTFAAPVTVTDLQVNFSTYNNGGWFGNASAGDPGSGQTLGDEGLNNIPFLLEPTLQVLYSGDTTWTTVADSSNYMTAMSNVSGNGVGAAPTVDFALSDPAANVVGIRVIGATGASESDDPNGFLGVAEEAAFGSVPEPSTWAMMACGFGLLAFGARRVRSRA